MYIKRNKNKKIIFRFLINLIYINIEKIMKVIRWVDFLRPKMNLKHRGTLFEKSILTPIVSLISILVIIASIVYFSRPLLFRQKPTIHIYEEFSQDNYTFSLNSSFFSHFVTFINNYYVPVDKMNLEYFRIIGVKGNLDTYQLLEQRIFDIDDYWIYGECDEIDLKIEDSDDDDYNKIFQEFYNNSFCIKKFYSSQERKYYDKNDIGFQWPLLSTLETKEGYDNSEYTIIIEKCLQTTLDLILGEGYQCKNDSEIYDYIEQGNKVMFSFLDYDVNLYDYDNPISTNWHSTIDKMYDGFMTTNTMVNNPLMIKTNKGVIFNKVKKKTYYELTREDKFNVAKAEEDKDIFVNYNIHFNKEIKYYERRYKKLLDVISQIGGFVKIVSSVARFIVRYYNGLKILTDVRDLISHCYNEEKKKSLEKRDKANETKIELNKSDKEMGNLDLNDQSLNKLKNVNNEKERTNSNINVNNQIKQDHNYNEKKKEDVVLDDNIRNNEEDEKEKKEESEENDEKSIFTEENRQFNIFSYIAYRYTLKKTFKKYKIYDNFINKVFSDEQFIKNHIILYNLSHNKNPDTQVYSLSDMLKDER